MKTLCHVLILLGTCSMQGPPAWAQIDKLEAQMDLVPKLVVLRSTGKEIAAGVYVGTDAHDAYFITAYHAIKSTSDGKATEIKLQFHGSARSVPAVAFDKFNISDDLGVVSTPVSELPTNLLALPRGLPAPDILVHVIGHPSGGGDWSVCMAGIINSHAPVNIHRFVTTRGNGNCLEEGYSGGPVLDADGNLFGIHLQTSDTYGESLSISEIADLLDSWHVPTTNLKRSESGQAILIKSPTKPEIFLVHNGERHHVPDAPTVDSLGGWAHVMTITQERVDEIPLGDPVPSVLPTAVSVQADKSTETIENALGTGIGPFRFGMSPEEVNGLLPQHLANVAWSSLPAAGEIFKPADVRYVRVNLRNFSSSDQAASFYGTLSAFHPCWEGQGYVTFFFAGDKLVHISVRLLGDCSSREILLHRLADGLSIKEYDASSPQTFHLSLKSVEVAGYNGPEVSSLEVFAKDSPTRFRWHA